MVTFYHRFVPSAAKIMQPLYTALKGTPKTLNWTKEMESAFPSTKLALANATMLVHPTVDSEISLTVDASDLALGGVLEQRIDGMWKPLAFFSANNSEHLSRSTALSTANYSPSISLSDISVTS